MKQTWDNLRDDRLESPGTAKGKILIPGAPVHLTTWKDNARVLDPDGNEVNKSTNTQEEADLFRLETLANFSRMLASPVGRHLVNTLNEGGNPVQVVMTREDMACGRLDGGTLPRASSVLAGLRGLPSAPRSTCRRGSERGPATRPCPPRTVTICTTRRSSAWPTNWSTPSTTPVARTAENCGFAERYRLGQPGRVSHHLRGQRPRNRLNATQYGLVTPRHAHHHIEPKDEVTEAFTNAANSSKLMSSDKKKRQIEDDLTAKGLDPAQLTDQEKGGVLLIDRGRDQTPPARLGSQPIDRHPAPRMSSPMNLPLPI